MRRAVRFGSFSSFSSSSGLGFGASLALFEVWHQYPPVVFVDSVVKEDGERLNFYKPAVYLRGTIEARDGADAIRRAIASGLSLRPMVRRAAS